MGLEVKFYNANIFQRKMWIPMRNISKMGETNSTPIMIYQVNHTMSLHGVKVQSRMEFYLKNQPT